MHGPSRARVRFAALRAGGARSPRASARTGGSTSSSRPRRRRWCRRCGCSPARTSSATPPKVRTTTTRTAPREGQLLFEQMNCSGCHANGGGGMGPPLMDDEWIYGSQPNQIFATHRRRAAERHADVEVPAQQPADLAARGVRALAERTHAEGRAAGARGSHDGEAGAHRRRRTRSRRTPACPARRSGPEPCTPFFDPGSPQARAVAGLWWWMFGVGMVVWLGVVCAMFYAVRARARPARAPTTSMHVSRRARTAAWSAWSSGAMFVTVLILCGFLVYDFSVGRAARASIRSAR